MADQFEQARQAAEQLTSEEQERLLGILAAQREARKNETLVEKYLRERNEAAAARTPPRRA